MKYSPAILLLLSLLATAQEQPPSRADYCADISSYAERILLAHQMGKSMESQIDSAVLRFDSEAEQQQAIALIERAWEVRPKTTTKRQQRQLETFSGETEAACLAGKIFPGPTR